MMKTESMARSYYRYINGKDVEGLLALFADDVKFFLPDGKTVTGKDALRSMYQRIFSLGGPQPQPVSMMANEHSAAAEVEVTLADGTVRHMASFFQTDDREHFCSVTVYQRG